MIEFKVYNTVNNLPDSWDYFAKEDVMLQKPFLTALEIASPLNITPFYVGVFKSEKLVGIALIQRVQMYLDDILRRTRSIAGHCVKQAIIRIVRGNALIVGNIMHTGQHGMLFNEQEIKLSDYLLEINKAIDNISDKIKSQVNKKIRILALKDFFEYDSISNESTFLKSTKLYRVTVQPNMILDIKPHWDKPEVYISEMVSKYRKRYRTARKKAKEVKKIELQYEDVLKHSATLYKLYKNISDNAKFNTFILPENHFCALKQHLKDKFKVIGYFINGELVGFYTLILNNSVLETYFLGYDSEHQYPNQLYLNMLYDMVFYGIENNFKSVVYARTAMEIKSSIGAQPYQMNIFMKHYNNFLVNLSIKTIVKYINPVSKWEERNPFGK